MMSMLSRRPVVIALAAVAVVAVGLAAVLAATGGDDDAQPTTTAAPTTSTTTSTTLATTTTAAPTYPLTGLPLADPAVAARPALVVKIDNAQPDSGRGARPQAGINEADIVYEEMVEGSVTRFAAVFHSTDADPVGPVRSARTTDLLIMAALNGPLFAWSGANSDVADQVRSAPVVDVGYDVASGAYYRDSGRPAPYNLFSSTGALRSVAPADSRPPPALLAYREPSAAPAGGRPVQGVGIAFGDGPGSAPVDFAWDGSGWARSQVGEPHVDAAGTQIAPPNVIVRFTPYAEVQCCDAAGFPIVEAQLVGEGTAWVLTAGTLIEARWTKAAVEQPTIYTDPSGQPVRLTPGRTWIAIAPPGSATAR